MNTLLVGNCSGSLQGHWGFLLPFIHAGWPIRAVRNGEDALNEYATFDPELIFADILLPGMSGFEMGRFIREQNGRARIIVVSEQFNMNFFSMAMEIGLSGYLSRNMEPSLLKQIVQGLQSSHYGFAPIIAQAAT